MAALEGVLNRSSYLSAPLFQAIPHGAHEKVNIALAETRMLILGAQILLGFQFRGVFSDGYEQLPTHVRYLDGLALALMICVVGLLITPGPYHRIVEDGEDSEHLHRLATVIAELALFPFALALAFAMAGHRAGRRPCL
jgi:Family of unknown function (DUF6328)